MDTQEIKELIQLVIDSGVAELEVQRGDNKVRILRSQGIPSDILLPAHTAMAPHLMNSMAAGQPAHAAPAAAPDPLNDPALFLQKAPIVGTFYEAPKPGAPPFARVGDRVEKGKVLCIIESMKLMNEIEAEESGVVAAKFVENGHPVEYGEALFAIKPA